MRRKLLVLLMTGSVLSGGVACDDTSPEDQEQMDEDDARTGPGDGSDETGPGR